MKQVLIDVLPFEFKKTHLNESTDRGKMVVSGVLQRAEAKNQNGRIYPKGILRRESEKYMENFVKQRRAMGELDHPECHRVSAQALTINGWKYIKDIVVDEKVATLNTKTNSIEYQPALRVINEPYKGKMISIKGKNIDVLVTPNHRFILNTRNGEFIEKTAQEIFEISKINKYPHLSIPTVADNLDDIFKIDDVKVEDIYRLQIKESKAIHLDFRFIKIEEVDYDDRVYCLTVDNGVFYCRDLNKCFWSGNSSVVNLKNVSHNIIDMGWDGDNLVGTVEILPTPSGNILRDLLHSGILLGISSRGLGSVKKDMKEGADVVQDDFDLIAFDFVSNPSTQGAFMYPSGKINESIESQKIINPYNNVDKIIHNILSDL
jgi:hypothetical protein